jgi:hypothetical protein
MSSRRSSRKSSRKSIKSNTDLNPDVKVFNESVKPVGGKHLVASFAITILFQSSLLYYLYNLEDVDCNCIRDWRHNFIKGMSVFTILIGLISFLGYNYIIVSKWTSLILMCLSIINFYAFFTYIGDLNDTKCTCAVDKQPNLNKVMNALRWIPFVIIGIFLLLIILALVFGFSLIRKI